MSDLIQEILQDLYALEPSLQQREAELIPLIQKLLAAKPNAYLDPQFREQLRQQLVHRLAVRSSTPFFTFFTMRKLSYALFGILALAAVGIGAYTYLNRPTTSTPVATTGTSRIAITNRESSAFGNFSSNPTASTAAPLGQALGLGGGTPAKSALDTTAPTPLIAPVPSTIEYVYAGNTFTIPTASVLKRTNQLPTAALQNVLQTANLGLVDLQKFSDLKVQQIALAEDKDQGYSVNIDLREGAVSLFQNWERWAQPLRGVAQNVNGSTTTLPSDDQLIAKANAFLDQYSIPRTAYGTPVVPKYFLGYGESTLKTGIGAVQSVQVVYPLVVDGKAVVNENGYPTGLTVDIDLGLNRVTSVTNLTGLSYEASAYPLVTDTATILDVVKRGGMYGSKPVDANVQKVRVEVGTPTIGYYPSRYQIDQTPTEYLVPALVFPITKAPAGEPLYRTAIVVPLVKDVLTPPTTILPSGSGGSGTAPAAGVTTPETQ